MGIQSETVDKVTKLILFTEHKITPNSLDGQFVVDIDLSILGSETSHFDDYEQAIRQEYSWVSDSDFVQRRSIILKNFLDKKSIFATDFFREKYEEQARKNIQRSLLKLHNLKCQ